MRDVVESSAPVEAIASPGAGSEQAVGNGLREQIGEICRRQRADEVGLERLEKAGERTGILPFLLELFADHIAEEACALGQFDSERFSGKRLGQLKVQEAVEQGVEFILVFERGRGAHCVEYKRPDLPVPSGRARRSSTDGIRGS